jgi:hypothetical protein
MGRSDFAVGVVEGRRVRLMFLMQRQDDNYLWVLDAANNKKKF